MTFSNLGRALLLGAAATLTLGTLGPANADDKATGKGLTIGWTQRGLSGSDWWKTMIAGGQAQADKVGAPCRAFLLRAPEGRRVRVYAG